MRSYLVRGARRALLWDTGLGIGNMLHEVERFVPVTPASLIVVQSHSHFDHVGDTWRFAARGVPIAAHPAEAGRIAQGLDQTTSAYWVQEGRTAVRPYCDARCPPVSIRERTSSAPRP